MFLTADVKTFAGSGRGCVQDGTLSGGSFAYPRRLSRSPDGAILVADNYPFGLRSIDAHGIKTVQFKQKQKMSIDVSAMAMHPNLPQVIFCDGTHHKVRRWNVKTGELNVLTGQLSGHRDGFLDEALIKKPSAITFACDGRVVLIGDGYGYIRTIDLQTGMVSTLAGGGQEVNELGRIVSFSELNIKEVGAFCVSKKNQGFIYLTDMAQHCVFLLDTANEHGQVVAGTPGKPGNGQQLNKPIGIVELDSGELVIADSANGVLKVLDPVAHQVQLLTNPEKGWSDGLLKEAQFQEPTDLLYEDGQIFVIDKGNHAVRIIRLNDPDAVKLSEELHTSNVRETFEQNVRQFDIFCQRCQQVTTIGNDHTCAKCGSEQLYIGKKMDPEMQTSKVLYESATFGSPQPHPANSPRPVESYMVPKASKQRAKSPSMPESASVEKMAQGESVSNKNDEIEPAEWIQPTPERPEQFFPEQFELDGDVFNILCNDLEIDLEKILLECPQASRRQNLINGSLRFASALDYQAALEAESDPLIFVRADEGTEYFSQELLVNKRGLQYTAYVDSAAVEISIQVISKKPVASVSVGGVELRQVKNFWESAKPAKCFAVSLDQLLASAQVHEDGIQVVGASCAFAGGEKSTFQILFKCGEAQGTGTIYDNVQIVYPEK